jgi:hypothetical protein
MLLLHGIQPNIETIVVLSRTDPHGAPDHGAVDLSNSFRRFLKYSQPQLDRVLDTQLRPNAMVVDVARAACLVDLFNQDSALDDTKYLLARPDESVERYGTRCHVLGARFDARANELETMLPEFGPVYRLAIQARFAATCTFASGGTTSDAIGVLWLNPSPRWTNVDYEEFLVHELCHTLIFLDELRFGLYTSQRALADPSHFALSAIRRQVRPLDKAFHSAVVAAELCLLRGRLGWSETNGVLHPGTEELRRSAGASIDSIRAVAEPRGLLTSHALDLLEQCEESLYQVA